MVREIFGDSFIPKEHDVETFQYWALNPDNVTLREAKCFLIVQILAMYDLGKSCASGIRANKNLYFISQLYKYDSTSSSYFPEGKSGLLKTCQALLASITKSIICEETDVVKFDHTTVIGL